MSVPEIKRSRYNRGNSSIVTTVTGDVELNINDIIALLREGCSDVLAKLINTLGQIYNSEQMTQCCSIDDIDADGKEFIENMNYFLESEIERRVTKKLTGGES